LHWLATFPAFVYGLEHRCIDEELRVAGHARFGGWNSCKVAFFDGGMTVTAINAVAANMALVAEGDGLLAVDTDLGD